MVQVCPAKWSNWLSLAEYWYNTTYHSALGMPPFEALCAHPPRHFGLVPSDACTSTDLKQWLAESSVMTQVIQVHLHRAQQRMKNQADKHRQEREFAVGDWVYLKLQPYTQQSVARRSNHKLSYKFFGPYLILQKIGAVAYKLQLPANSKIHPVIHVSQLKAALPPDTISDAVVVPDTVVATKLFRVGAAAVPHVLIRWTGLPPSWVTWEKLEEFKARFPSTAA